MTVPSIDALVRERDRVIGSLAVDPFAPGARICLYGAGFLGEWAVRWLRQRAIEPTAFFDGYAERHGSLVLGVPVHAPSYLAVVKPDFVFVTARHAVAAVAPILEAQGVAACSLDAYIAAMHFQSFLDVHDGHLRDARSQETLRSVLMAMLTGDRAPLSGIVERDQYFCLPQFSGRETESYVDAGAYVGDSIERFIWANAGVFAAIHAFEPGDRQFAALEKRVARLIGEWALAPDAIVLNRAGLAEGTARLGAASRSGQLQSLSLANVGDGDIIAGSLDDYLGGARVSFIKADVEGMELALLKGAAHTIARFKPKLAICVYHYPLDIPEIAAFIRGLVPEYNFALRHHSPQLMETVLYCWTE